MSHLAGMDGVIIDGQFVCHPTQVPELLGTESFPPILE